MSGADLRTVRSGGLARDLSLVQRYSHLSPDHCSTEAIERIVEEFSTKLPPMPETGLSYGLQNDVQACNYAKVLRPTERCESGRIGQSRKLLSWQRDRGFDPHPLRQTKLACAAGLLIKAGG
jgi:hypothetical protein